MTELERAARKPVVLLTSGEVRLLTEALDDLLRIAEVDREDFETEFLEADAVDPQEWVARASTVPFLAARRCVVVRYLERIDAKRMPSTAMGTVPDTGFLVLIQAVDSSARGAAGKGWEAAVKSAGGAVLDLKTDPKKLPGVLRARASALGVSMMAEAAETLVEMTGGSYSRAMEECEKLALFVGPEGTVRAADVRAVAVPSREWQVFEMLNAIFARDIARALRAVRTMVAGTRDAHGGAQTVVSLSLRQLRLLWQLRHLDSNLPELEAAPLSKLPGGVQRRMQDQISRLSAGDLALCMAVVADAEARLKGSLPAHSPEETLERMILELGAALAR
jgi:DNA polymerase-3 subunit delta